MSESMTPTSDTLYLSRDLLIDGGVDSLAQLASALNVIAEHRYRFEAPCDFSSLGNNANTLFYGEIKGDFSFKIDLHLFDRTFAELDATLLTLSTRGVRIGLPDDRSSMPFRYVYYADGRRSAVDVVENCDSSFFTLYRKDSP
jgi:hypothetical protein